MNGHAYFKSIAICTSLTLILTACGGGDDGGGNPPSPDSANHAPSAQDISLQSDLINPYINIKLIGSDEDNDTLSYVLEAASEGPGYEQAFADPNTGDLYATLKSDGTDTIIFPSIAPRREMNWMDTQSLWWFMMTTSSVARSRLSTPGEPVGEAMGIEVRNMVILSGQLPTGSDG